MNNSLVVIRIRQCKYSLCVSYEQVQSCESLPIYKCVCVYIFVCLCMYIDVYLYNYDVTNVIKISVSMILIDS